MTLDEVWKKIQKAGPTYILLDKDGTTQLTPVAMQKNPDLQWDIIYIRNDGYSLGCEFYLAQYAEALHRNEWIGMVPRGAARPRVMNFRLDSDRAVVV